MKVRSWRNIILSWTQKYHFLPYFLSYLKKKAGTPYRDYIFLKIPLLPKYYKKDGSKQTNRFYFLMQNRVKLVIFPI